MPVTNVGSRWSSGDLIFYEKNVSLGTIGNVLTIGDDAVTVGSATNDINFSWKGTTTGTFDLDAGGHTAALTGLTLACDGAVTFTSTLAVTSAVTLSSHLSLADDMKINFGDSNDFSMYYSGGWIGLVANTGGQISFYCPSGITVTAPVTINDNLTIAATFTAGAIICNGNAGVAGTLTAGILACSGDASVAGALTVNGIVCNDTCGVAGILTVSAHLVIVNIPVADPNVAGELWDNGGVVTRSHG